MEDKDRKGPACSLCILSMSEMGPSSFSLDVFCYEWNAVFTKVASPLGPGEMIKFSSGTGRNSGMPLPFQQKLMCPDSERPQAGGGITVPIFRDKRERQT